MGKHQNPVALRMGVSGLDVAVTEGQAIIMHGLRTPSPASARGPLAMELPTSAVTSVALGRRPAKELRFTFASFSSASA